MSVCVCGWGGGVFCTDTSTWLDFELSVLNNLVIDCFWVFYSLVEPCLRVLC